jgi:hypothetical protein
LARIFYTDDLLFSRCREFPGPCGPVPHALYGVHHITFLSQKRISKVRRPGNVFGQVLHDTGKNHESLNTGIPVLIPCGLGQRLISKIRIALDPLTGFDDFKRIRCGDKNLADQRIRIQRNRCDQIIELIRRKKLGGTRVLLCLQRGSRTHQHGENCSKRCTVSKGSLSLRHGIPPFASFGRQFRRNGLKYDFREFPLN